MTTEALRLREEIEILREENRQLRAMLDVKPVIRPWGLSPAQARIVLALIRAGGAVVSAEWLMKIGAGLRKDAPECPDRIVHVHISQARRRMAAAGAPVAVETIRGAGYRVSGDIAAARLACGLRHSPAALGAALESG